MNVRTLLVSAAALLALPVQAGTWRYDYAPGKTYHYAFQSDSKVAMKMPMMGELTTRVRLETDYSLAVEKQLADGRYDVAITIDRLVIHDASSGQKTTLSELPEAAKRARAYVTPRGRFQFYERVVLQVSEGGAYAIGQIHSSPTGGSAAATASDGQEEVTLVASIDMKTGKATATLQRKAAKKRTRTQTEERPAQLVEMFPAQVLALMELPEGPVQPGLREEFEGMGMKVVSTAGAPTSCGKARCGVLDLKTAGEVSGAKAVAPVAAAHAQGQAEEEEEAGGGMGSMGGMVQLAGMQGMPAMPGMPAGGGGAPDMELMAAGGVAGSTQMNTELDMRLLFDEAAGNLHQLRGKMRTSSSMMGMTTRDDTEFTLRAVGR